MPLALPNRQKYRNMTKIAPKRPASSTIIEKMKSLKASGRRDVSRELPGKTPTPWLWDWAIRAYIS